MILVKVERFFYLKSFIKKQKKIFQLKFCVFYDYFVLFCKVKAWFYEQKVNLMTYLIVF